MTPPATTSVSKTTSTSATDTPKVVPGASTILDNSLPSTSLAEGVNTRSAARQEAMLQSMQKHIVMLENRLKAAHQKIKEHESASESRSAEVQSIASALSESSANGVNLPPMNLMPQLQVSQPQTSIPTSSTINVSTVHMPQQQNSAVCYPPYTAPRHSPPIYTFSASGSAAATAINNMYATPSFPGLENFSNISSTVPVSANMGSAPLHFSSQPRKLQDLPDFSGKPEDWPIFFTAFTESTAIYGYSCSENNQRLQKCLKGEAREAIKSLLIHPSNVGNVIEQLKFRFGRPEQLIRSQLANVREIAPIAENALAKLVPFAAKVSNICAFLQSAHGGEQHITNPTLLDELVSKLPMSKRVEWAVFVASLQSYATVRDFSEWLTKLANVICTIYDGESGRDSKRRVVLHATESQRQPTCPVCQGHHRPAECKQFSQLAVSKRWEEVKRLHMCFGCLNIGHGSRNCQRRKQCGIDGCKRTHHKLLHETGGAIDELPSNSGKFQHRARHVPAVERNKQLSIQTQPALGNQQGSTGAAVLNCSNDVAEGKLLFRILPVTLYGNQKCVETFALLDEGSSITMVDNTLIDELGLRGRSERLNVQWFGGRAADEPAVVVDLLVSGSSMQKKHKLRNVYGVSNLQLPVQSLSKADMRVNDSRMKTLAVQPYTHVRPKLLIGLDHCHLGLPSTTTRMNKDGPFAANTELGWVVFGPTTHTYPTVPSCLLLNFESDLSLHKIVADYFATESFGVRPAAPIESEADMRSKEILKSTTCRVEGRCQTGLLWKRENVMLPSSYSMALKRLTSIEAKMKRDANFGMEYRRIMNSYVEKNYARKLSPKEASLSTARTWYLPHFAVSNPNKPGKLRMVFDAAAEVDSVSLNSQLLKGPQDYRPLTAILFHFREGAIGVCGDIKEMFHQVLIQPADRCAQRFLWRNGDATKQPDVYEMRVMTFGAACSPCAANYIKMRNAVESRTDDSGNDRAVKSILEYHYVDDYVDSFETEEQAVQISKQVKSIHSRAGFELRNFASNSSSVTKALGGSVDARQISSKDGVMIEKVLGLFWQSSSDSFRFKLKFNKVDPNVLNGIRRPTKRELLSVVMSVFDPLGFLSNFVVGAKLLMREVWKHDIRWDEPLPNVVNTAWEGWRKQLPLVINYEIQRHYFTKGSPKNLQLHIFVDASEDAFAAVAYWRATSAVGVVEVSFVCAKTKCAPIKPLTIPRLELQAAVLGTRLMSCIRKEHSVAIDNCIIWSDSKTVIQWLRSEHRRYKPFVQHRVAEILADTTIANWRWLPTDQNVGDEATRSNNQVNFSSTSRWSCGPQFLLEDEYAWPSEVTTSNNHHEADEELRPKYALTMVTNNFLNFNRFSSFDRLVRTVAWVLRFINICRRRDQPDRRHGLTAKEVESAKLFLCRIVQRDVYAEDIQQIENKHNLAQTSPLIQLSPYIDGDGVLRVHGRIEAASWLPISSRRPIILPPSHIFTRLLVMRYHNIMRHQNSEATISEVRRSYWVPRLRNLLRRIIAGCAVCRLNKASALPPLMGPLPIDRLTPYVRPFTYTGLDYFGPVTVTNRRSTEKRWVALFTCLTVRAVHLELAHDLSTDSCIVAIRNFINRRGVPSRIRSDNGKNFVGADMEAKRFDDVFDCERLQSELSQRGVEWVFNSPFNPSEGGAWERLVQCVKRVLRQTLKEASPREHTLNCFLIEAENIVNSRPLTHLPIDADQEQPLTPNDFLLGDSHISRTPAVNDVLEQTCRLRQQWRIAKQLRDHFWKRWIAEYLPTLTRRVKWCQRTKPLEVGDIVLICDPNVPRREWRRGKVEAVYPGADGEIRRADVRTSTGLKRRAVSKLAVLDVGCGESG